MSHFSEFLDGVTVKLSEKYKRPPEIDLPYSVIECPKRAQSVVDIANYSCTFEKNVLAKLKELRSAKETKKNERRHRLQLLQEAEQKRLDAIAAAEDEERLKQLSVSEVSYPSTDEISALSPDEKADNNCDNTKDVENTPENAEASNITYPSTSNTRETEPHILQPIQVQSNFQEGSLLDDPDPLQKLKMNTKITKIPYNPNVETMTFRDFENDTSSPFDNVELKTINDMELLAQVLQNQRDSSVSCHPQPGYVPEQTYIPNCMSQTQIEGITYLPNTYIEQPIQGPGLMYTTTEPYTVTNGYYIPTESDNMYMQNYQYYVPQHPYMVGSTPYYGNPLPTTSADTTQVQNGSTYIQQPYYYQYPQIPAQYPANAENNLPLQTENTDQNTLATQNNIKSRSRSVPDIVQELNEELAKLRFREQSHNISPSPKPVPQETTVKKKDRKSKRAIESLPNPLDTLPPKLQEMCRKIHGMGFPIDRVARMCTLVGDNDKKVIEGLLILDELMDLGFSEGKVSAALANHEFNRDKALDELVS